jgi:CheY-like chemotaxis protein
VAHEVNNPLTYTLGNLESLAMRVETNPASLGTEEAREAVRDAIDGCQRIATIIRELRSFYRSDDQQVALLDPNQVVRDAVRIVAPKCASVARLVMDLGDLPPVRGVQTSLVQVLINLIVNAIDAMPDRSAAENVVRVSTGCRGHDIRIEVADNGRGIPPEDLSRIFEPFFSRGKATGTGLGLTISRNMIEQMNGWIDVDSRVGAGTRFIVHLEAASRQPSARGSEPPPIPAAVIADVRILVVDDEPLVARSVSRLLGSASEVICVHSVTSALDILLARPDIDLVISDWVMPDGGAAALVRGLQARGRDDIPFVVMTGLGQLGLTDHVEGPCVAKPVSRNALLTAVAEALLGARHRRSMVVRVDPSESASFPAIDPDDTPLPDAESTGWRRR